MPARTIQAEYAGGILRPLAPLDLAEGQRVTLTLADADRPTWDPDRAKAAIREVAALPPEADHPPGDRTSEEHDQHLYGDPSRD